MKKHVIMIAMALFTSVIIGQQFDLSAELRPRYENRHGYKSLFTKDTDGANFISQRSRLNFDYSNQKIKMRVTLQNIRVWGDVGTLSSDDKATALHEAWAEAILSSKFSLKLGRQEIVYDDHRIFGNVGWAQQARSHDAFLIKYTPDANNRLDVGFALNADAQANVDNLYSNAAGYKTFQYAWYHGKFTDFGVSFLLLNTGIEYLENEGAANEKQTVDYMQTIGPRLTYKKDKLSANAAAYFQTGKTVNTDVSASYFSANLGYKINSNFNVAAGFEFLSGKDMDDTDAKLKSFAPLFGTNHKFNGWMDYFYVGNHANSVGLTDIYGTIGFKKDKFSAKIVPHFFSSAANVIDTNGDKMSNGLGTEVDFTMGYKLSNSISVNAGYSKMFATDTMEVLKGGDKDADNSWGWIMITFKPNLFSFKPAQQ